VSVLEVKLRRDLVARRAQFVAVGVTIFLGLALFAVAYDAYLNLKASYARVFVDLHFADYTASGGRVREFAAAARATAGVAQVSTRSVADVPLRVAGSHKVLGRLVGMPAAAQPPIDSVMILRGRYLDPSRPDAVLVEKHMAEHFGLHPGDRLEVLDGGRWRPLVVIGVAASAEYIWPARDRQQLLISQDDFGVLFASEDLVRALPRDSVQSQSLVAYKGSADRLRLDEEMRALAARSGAIDAYTRADQPSNAALSEDINGFGEMAIMFPVLFLGAAGMATYVLLTRLVLAQRATIGLLMANGFSRASVFRHYLAFGLIVGLAGAVPGVVVGMLLAGLLTRFYTNAVSVPIRVIGLHPETLAVGLAFGLVAGALATLAPALRAASAMPAEAMRGILPPGAGRPSLFERLVPPLRRLPTRWKMVLRSSGRSRRRSASTVLGIVLAVTLLLASLGMLDTTKTLISRQFKDIQRQDAQVFFTPQDASAVLARLASLRGVAHVEGVADLPVAVRGRRRSYSTSLLAFAPATTMHRFRLVGGEYTALPKEGVLLGGSLRTLLDVRAGDRVTIASPTTGSSLTETVVGFVDEPLGTFAYMGLPALERRIGSPAVDSGMVVYAANADRAVMRERLSSIPGVTAFVDSRSLYTTVQSYMGLFYVFVGAMVVLGAIMALALVFTSMSANISERVSEMATLRVVGMGRRRLARLITAENLLLTLAALVPGLLVGYLAAAAFMASFSSDLFSFGLTLRPLTPLFVAAAVVIAALLSQWPVLRAVDRIDVARVVRERSL
jgi:putative ABC transport system permease protein